MSSRTELLRLAGTMGAVAFGMGYLAADLSADSELDVVFEPKINAWQGRRTAELHIKDLRLQPVEQPVSP